MSGVSDEYVTARRILLDALEALKEHRSAVILVGAQAIYLHTGPSALAMAELTTDADLALDPAALGREPELEQAMRVRGCSTEDRPFRNNIGMAVIAQYE